jgi:hypothetical protein
MCNGRALFNVHALSMHSACGSMIMQCAMCPCVHVSPAHFLFFATCDKCAAQKEDKKVQRKGLKSGSCLFSESLDYLVSGDSSRIQFLTKERFGSFILF